MPSIDDNLGGDTTISRDFDAPEKPGEQSTYLDAARQGKASLWRYLAGFVCILFFWLGLGSLATGVMLVFFSLLEQLDMAQMAEALLNPAVLGPIPYFVILNVSFILFFAGIWLAAVGIHRRPLRSVVTAKPNIHWKRIGSRVCRLVLAGDPGQRHRIPDLARDIFIPISSR